MPHTFVPTSGVGRVRFIAILLFAIANTMLVMSMARGAEDLDEFGPDELRLFLALATASERAYDDTLPGLVRTRAGCVALVEENSRGDLVIAFRGSMLGDRNPKHRFSNLGGANIRRNYRDWAATNLKQATGFLPRQYVEAAALLEERVREHPVDKLVYVTGHSKGGGAATYAAVAASLALATIPELTGRMRVVTFNAAVVREQNWRRLLRRREAEHAVMPRDSILALVMRDDPVSQIAQREERGFVRRVVIEPSAQLTPYDQHGIGVVIDEIERRLEAMASEDSF